MNSTLVERKKTMVETSSLRTLKIMPRNLNVSVRSWIPSLYSRTSVATCRSTRTYTVHNSYSHCVRSRGAVCKYQARVCVASNNARRSRYNRGNQFLNKAANLKPSTIYFKLLLRGKQTTAPLEGVILPTKYLISSSTVISLGKYIPSCHGRQCKQTGCLYFPSPCRFSAVLKFKFDHPLTITVSMFLHVLTT